MNPSGTNDLVITIGGDLSDLQASLNQIPQLATGAFGELQAALQSIDFSSVSQGADQAAESIASISTASDTVGQDLSAISQSMSDAGDASETAASGLDDASTAMSGTADSAGAAASAVEQLPPALDETAESAENAESGLAGMAEQLVALGEGLVITEALKEFGTEALLAGAAEQSAAIALQALGSSAEQANETVEALVQTSMQIPVATASLLQAQERMQAVGIPLAQISTLMLDVAASSATMGTNITRATMQLDNMVTTGTVAQTTLSRLGISVQSFVAAINQVGGEGTADISNFTAAFKQLDQSQAIEVLEISMKGLADNIQAQAQSINGQLQILKNSWEAVMVDIGQAIAPSTGAIVTGLTSVIQTVQAAIAEFQQLPAPIVAVGGFLTQLAGGLAVIGVGMVGFIAALGAAGLALATFNSAAVQGPLMALSGAVTGAVVSLGELALGATVASGAITALTAASATLGIGLALWAGWQIGHVVSDWINDLDGFTAAQQKAAEQTQNNTNVISGNAAASAAGAAANADFAQSLQTLGVGMDQLTAKGTTARTAIQSYANAAQEASTQIANADTDLANSTQLLNDYTKVIGSASSSTTEIGAASALYDKQLQVLVKDQEAANGGLENSTSAALLAANAFSQLNIATANSQTTFTAVAAAYASGGASLSQYTTALTAMNKAQMDANNGIELGSTAALLAANDYTNAAAKATNAATTVTALGAAAQAGTASWTQYDSALKQLVTDEEAANNGFLSLHTAMLVQAEDFQELGTAEANAEATFAAVQDLMLSGAASVQQYTTALNALNAAQMALNGGLQELGTALLMSQNAFRQMQVAAANAETTLQATLQAYNSNTAGLNQLIDATDSYVKAQLAANGGVQTWQTAQAQLAATQAQLTIAFQNANTVYAQAEEMYANGTLSLGALEKAQQAVITAQNALNGVTAAATGSTNSLKSAQDGLTSAFTAARGAATGLTGAMDAGASVDSVYATNLQVINGQLVQLGQYSTNATVGQSTLGSTLNVVNGQFVNMGTVAAGAVTSGLNPMANSLQQINGQLVTLSGAAGNAATGISSIGTAAASAASQVGTLGAELDKLAGESGSLGSSLDNALNAPIGSLNMNLTPGEQIGQPTGKYITGTGDTALITDPSQINNYANGTLNVPGDTYSTYDPQLTAAGLAAFNAALPGATSGLNAVATAATAASTSTTTAAADLATSMTTASAAALGLTVATNGVVTAANGLVVGFVNTTTGLVELTSAITGVDLNPITELQRGAMAAATSVTGLSSAALNSGNSVASLTAAASAASTSLGVISGTADAAGSALDTLTTASEAAAAAQIAAAKAAYPTGIGYGSGVGGTSNGVPLILSPNTILPSIGTGTTGGPGGTPAPAAGGITLQINAGNVVGNGGMQQLTNIIMTSIVNTLASRGIRLNRQ